MLLALRFRSRGVLAVLLGLLAASCGGAPEQAIEDHPAFPCYTWWLAASRVAGLAGLVSYGVPDDLFTYVAEWVPDSDANDSLDELDAARDAAMTDEQREMWDIRVILGVYEWALFHLDLAKEGIESSPDISGDDRQPLRDYVGSLSGWVEDQWALAVPLFESNPRIDVTTLGVLTNNTSNDRLYQAWRDVTEDSPFDTEAGIKDAAANVCGEEVYEIGA